MSKKVFVCLQEKDLTKKTTNSKKKNLAIETIHLQALPFFHISSFTIALTFLDEKFSEFWTIAHCQKKQKETTEQKKATKATTKYNRIE